MRGFACFLALCLWSVATQAQAQTQAQNVAVDVILSRAADYVAVFVERFANVVTEERSRQIVRPVSMNLAGFRQERELRSDLLIVKDGSLLGWNAFRDVFEVDGKPVRDREERLTKLFAQPATTGWTQAVRISEESARYNIGPGTRTTNTPELSILFLQRSLQPRFAFSAGSRDRSAGDRVRVVEYREQARPTVVRNDENGDLPATGRFWIDVDSGMVTETEMTLRPTGGVWVLTTVFKVDDRFGIAVPVEMTERFQLWSRELTGTATYGRFRSFGVTTEETVQEK